MNAYDLLEEGIKKYQILIKNRQKDIDSYTETVKDFEMALNRLKGTHNER